MNEKILKERVKLELDRGDEAYKAAKNLFEDELYAGSISSAYYAMFHSVIAVLLTVGKEPSSHKGAAFLFSQHFIKTSVFEEKFNAMFIKAKEAREDSDYDVTVKFSRKDAEERLKEMEKFVGLMKEFLKGKNLL